MTRTRKSQGTGSLRGNSAGRSVRPAIEGLGACAGLPAPTHTLARQSPIPSIERLEDRVVPVSTSWTGAVSTSWNNPNNWNPAQVPKATGDTATFGDQTITNNAVVDVTGGVTLDQLTITAGFANNSITVSGANTLAVGKDKTTSSMAAGSIVLNNGGQFLVFRSAVFNWTGGTFAMIDNASTVEVAAGTFNIAGAASSMQANLRVDATGIVNLTSSNDVTMGHFVAPPGTSYSSNVSNAGIIDAQVDHGFLSYNTSAPGTFTNTGTTGTFMKSAGTGTTTVGLNFTNSGTFKIQSGTVSFTNTASQAGGTTTLYNNTTLAVAGEYNVSGGVFQGNGATTTVRGNLTVSNGTVYPGGDGLVGTLKVTNNFTMNGGTLSWDNDIEGDDYDQVQVTNQFSVGGTLAINTLNGTPPPSATYDVILYGSLLGTQFSGFTGDPGGLYISQPQGPGPSYQLLTNPDTSGSSPASPALSSSSSRHVTSPMSLGPASLAQLLGPGTSGPLPVGAGAQGLVTGWGSQTDAGLWWLPFPYQADASGQVAADAYFANLSAALDASLLAFAPAAT